MAYFLRVFCCCIVQLSPFVRLQTASFVMTYSSIIPSILLSSFFFFIFWSLCYSLLAYWWNSENNIHDPNSKGFFYFLQWLWEQNFILGQSRMLKISEIEKNKTKNGLKGEMFLFWWQCVRVYMYTDDRHRIQIFSAAVSSFLSACADFLLQWTWISL